LRCKIKPSWNLKYQAKHKIHFLFLFVSQTISKIQILNKTKSYDKKTKLMEEGKEKQNNPNQMSL
jgi:hypothetical protein